MHSTIPTLPIHGEGQIAEHFEALHTEVLPHCHRSHDTSEDEKVFVLGAQKRLRFEEGDDPFEQVITTADDEHQAGVLRAAVVLTDPSAAEPPGDQVEDLTTLRRLADMELRHELPTGSRTRVPLDGYVERPFSIHEACNVGIQPFLLIVRTDRIFTAHITTLMNRCDMNE